MFVQWSATFGDDGADSYLILVIMSRHGICVEAPVFEAISQGSASRLGQ